MYKTLSILLNLFEIESDVFIELSNPIFEQPMDTDWKLNLLPFVNTLQDDLGSITIRKIDVGFSWPQASKPSSIYCETQLLIQRWREKSFSDLVLESSKTMWIFIFQFHATGCYFSIMLPRSRFSASRSVRSNCLLTVNNVAKTSVFHKKYTIWESTFLKIRNTLTPCWTRAGSTFAVN